MRGWQRAALALLSLLATTSDDRLALKSYPNKPIRMIVSIAAGSVTDVIMRAAATELQPRLGQPVVIENNGGASGIRAGNACAQAAPDGYNICVIYHSTMSFNPLLFSNLPYNPDTDFVPISRLFFLVEGVFASTPINVNTIDELKKLRAEQARRSQLCDARRRLLPRPVHALAEQSVGHQDRRHSVSRRRPGRAGARRQRRAGDALRRRQLHGADRRRQGEGAGRRPRRSARRCCRTCRRSARSGSATIRAKAGGDLLRRRARRPRP